MGNDISFVIVNYNSLVQIKKLISSIYEKLFESSLVWEAIVVDNASEDGSISYLKKLSQEDLRIKFVPLEKNYGFARASNVGARKAVSGYIIFLNPDTVLIDDNLADFISIYRKNDKAGAIGPKMLNADFSIQRNARSFPTLARQFYESFFLHKIFPSSRIFGSYFMTYSNYGRFMEVDWLSGAFIFCSKELFEKAGGFDESYFLFSEDTDLCLRIKRMGYVNYFYPGYRVIHDDGAVSSKNFPKRLAQIIKARNIYFCRNYCIFSAKIITLLCFAFLLNRALLFFVLSAFRPKKGYFGKAFSYLKAFGYYFKK